VLARFAPTALRVAGREICARADCPPDQNGDCVDCPEAFLLAPPQKRAVTLRGYGIGLIARDPLSLSMIVLVLMVLALVAFEGFMDTAQWIELMVSLGELEESDGIHAPVKTTLSFLAATAILFALFYAVCVLMRMIGYAGVAPKRGTLDIMGLFVLSLVPISIAYHVAHYFSYLLIGGQYAIPLLSDPFGLGWNLFGTASYRVDIGLVDPRLQWYVAVISIVLGHVIAVYLAHVTALRTFSGSSSPLLTQIPMLFLMVGYTMCSLWILSQPIVETSG